MARATQKLDELAALLERTGGEPQRLEAVRRAQNFRRSWLDLAKVLAEIRSKRRFERWGYTDFFTYCKEELTLKKATVDKLTMSYRALEQHAPQVLTWDGVAKTIPSYEAIDYYAKAMGPSADADAGEDAPAPRPKSRRATPERMDELSSAVFDEGRPVAELRKTFDPIFFPKPKGTEKLGVINKANAAARKLAELLPDIEGLPANQVGALEVQLGKLRTKLDELAEPLKAQVAEARAKARKAQPARASKKLREGEAASEGAPARAPKKAPRVKRASTGD